MARIQRQYEQRYPYTLELIKSYDYLTNEEVDSALETAHQAFLQHSLLPLEQRIEKVLKFASIMEEKSQQLAEAITFSMGKTIGVSQFEVGGTCMMIRAACEGAPN